MKEEYCTSENVPPELDGKRVATETWGRLCASQDYPVQYREPLMLYCLTWHEITEHTKAIDEEGYVVGGKANPRMRLLEQARGQIRQLLRPLNIKGAEVSGKDECSIPLTRD